MYQTIFSSCNFSKLWTDKGTTGCIPINNIFFENEKFIAIKKLNTANKRLDHAVKCVLETDLHIQ